MKVKKYVIYAIERFVMIKIKKANLSFIIKLEIIVIAPENLKVLLIMFAIEDTKYLKNSYSIS